MEKESNNFKAQNRRFIFLVIFILLIVNRTFAQCVDSAPGSSCHTNINFDPGVYTTCYKAAGDLTDLKQSGLTNVKSVTITNGTDNSITSMTITGILVKDAGCLNIDGPFDAGSFPVTTYGIAFQNGTTSVKISVPTAIIYGAIPVGSHIIFLVNAFKDATLLASRRYVFKIVANSYILGEPHITTVNGVTYALQAAGEFVALTGDGLEIQTRQTPITTPNYTFSDPYTELNTCVSINSAVAARVGTRRVTWEPNINGKPDPSGMQLRVDGDLTTLNDNGIDLGSGGRISSVMKSSTGGDSAIEIDFPDGASLVVTSTFWVPFQQWYLNLAVSNTAASKGLSGSILRGSWLPALPDGRLLGNKPDDRHNRFVQLNDTFANAWRVTDTTSLFDYLPGTSTTTFTDKTWPSENVQFPCIVNKQKPLKSIGLQVAQELCRDIVDPNMKANAIFDVMVTGDSGFASSYLLLQRVKNGTTATTVNGSKDTTKYEEPVTFTANVSRKFSAGKDILTGSVEFTVDGKKIGEVKLDANGTAILTTTSLKAGRHEIAATFTPDSGSTAFSSISLNTIHTVIGTSPILHQWWFWLIILLIIIGIIIALLRKKKSL